MMPIINYLFLVSISLPRNASDQIDVIHYEKTIDLRSKELNTKRQSKSANEDRFRF